MCRAFSFFIFFLYISISAFSQQTDKVDFLRLHADLDLILAKESLSGKVVIEFKILKNIDVVFLDAKNMQASLAPDSKVEATLSMDADKLWIKHNFVAGRTYEISFLYTAEPKQTLYFTGWNDAGSNQVFTQGQGKETSHWLPSIDDLNEKIEFDLSITAPKNYRVIANGKLVDSTSLTGKTRWEFDMEKPMSSYLVALAIGDFQYKTIYSQSDIPIKLFYEAKDSLKVETTYRHSDEIFDFLEKEIGVDFPWKIYKQVPVRDFLYAGMENTTLTIFSEAFVIDSVAFIDRNYVNVNAHELAHQWFGNLVTEKSSTHHWLQEGFATYYALLAEKEIFGDDYFYFKLYQSAESLKARSDKGKGEAVLNPKAGSLTFYQKGAWALHILREKIGAEAFREAVKNYLQKHAYQNVETADFISEAEKTSGMNLSGFVENWLEQPVFRATEALNSLKKSAFIRDYLALAALRETAFDQKKEKLSAVFNFPFNEYLGQEAVLQLPNENISVDAVQLYKKAFETNHVLIRQAISTYLTNIPLSLKNEYESLLTDDSYLTRENALRNLWINFPENRKIYLEQTKNVEGFPDKNIELLWLALNLITTDYQPENKDATYSRLYGYASPQYAYPIRQNAFGYLYQLNAFSKKNYKDLLEGCMHRVWRFRNFCRELLDELIKDENHYQRLESLEDDELSEKEKKFRDERLGL